MKRVLAAALSLAAILLSAFPTVSAHDIPSDVQVRMFFKPEGSQLRVLVRVPLASIIETDWPERGPGLLDLSRAERSLRDGALVRISDDLSIFEGDRRLDAPRVAAVMASLPSDRSFDSYESALAHTTGPRLPDDTEFVIAQGLLDVLFEYQIQSDHSAFAIQRSIKASRAFAKEPSSASISTSNPPLAAAACESLFFNCFVGFASSVA